jgi:hypothetical protein
LFRGPTSCGLPRTKGFDIMAIIKDIEFGDGNVVSITDWGK